MRVSLFCYSLAFACGLASAATAQTEAQVEAAGASFPYVQMGEGEPVLFIHGALADHRLWDGIRGEVAADYRFLALTMRHFGTGEWPDDRPYSRDVHEADLIAVLQAWGEPMHLVAWSYSGPVALRAAIEEPDLVRSIVIYEPTLESIVKGTAEGDAVVEQWYAGFSDTAAAHDAGDFEEAVREAIEYVFGMEEGGFATLPEAAQDVLLANAHTIPLDFVAPPPAPMTCEELGTVKVPTLLIVGSETLPIFEEGAKAIADCMQNSVIQTIDGVGHGGPLLSRDAFLSTLLDFLAQNRS